MATGTPIPPRRFRFATADRMEARDFLDRAYGARLRLGGFPDTGPLVTLDQVQAGALTLVDFRLASDLVFEATGQDDVMINTVLDGSMVYDSGKAGHGFRPGDVGIGNHPHMKDLVARSHALHLHTVGLPASLLTEVAGSDPAQDGWSWELLSLRPIDGGDGRWRRTTRFVDDLLAEPETAASPLLLGPAARLLAATVLTIFPNTAVAEPAAADSLDGHPGTLRRATAFIDSHPDLDISVADIARAAHVTPRAVQLAFRRHLDTTPTAYLRQVRLAQAHRQLREATPGDGVTVTAVAARWGFTPSRFTAHYRAAYGVTPSSTLRT
ncbi:AraC-like DNA-binding protein [Geodermatophilus normandii]|uniref:AraC-like DNA-binding protein n=1 Tax=Geodermatophilus normandii TaxID=1137989 RepID=A0A317QEW3_9ACTN|nr:helix-turn-helix transcriptional regulator [Geodermatophilus normandii]PWW20885.1 AraC-like DNA-binding protein [Geodermatophilus normandii]